MPLNQIIFILVGLVAFVLVAKFLRAQWGADKRIALLAGFVLLWLVSPANAYSLLIPAAICTGIYLVLRRGIKLR